MMESIFKKISGNITLDGINGKITIEVQGDRVPQDQKEVPEYVAQCVKRALFGGTDNDVARLKETIENQKKQIEVLIAEKNQIKQKKNYNK